MKIELQRKTQVEKGVIESYWFENKSTGFPKTLLHRITLFLKAFDSGIDYEDQPVRTEIILEWYNLGLSDPSELHGLNLSHANYPDAEGSVYLGYRHNYCDVIAFNILKNIDGGFDIAGKISIEFENEEVGENEEFTFQTRGEFIVT